MANVHATLGKKWQEKPGKIDWLGLEDLLVEILNTDDTADERVALAKEALDAFTRRGHFIDQPHYGR